MTNRVLHFTLCGLLFFLVTAAQADCHGQAFDPLDIDLNGIYPITLGSAEVVDGSLPDTANSDSPFCMCQLLPPKPGFAVGYWEPMALVDVTRAPYCLVSIDGKQLDSSVGEGAVDTQSADQNSSFYYVHYYNFPVLKLLEGMRLLGGTCKTDYEPFAPTYFSELDPTWNDEQAAAILFPEGLVFGNPVAAFNAQAACALDSAAANTGLALDEYPQCLGSQGFLYPVMGEVAEHASIAQATTLIAERVVVKLHRLPGMPIRDTSRYNLCSEETLPVMPKSRYRYQMVYPSKAAAQPFGRSTIVWESGVYNPLNGDDSAYLIFRKRNCCQW